jgi:hypothetical protein
MLWLFATGLDDMAYAFMPKPGMGMIFSVQGIATDTRFFPFRLAQDPRLALDFAVGEPPK